MVELRGFEPLTSTLRTLRATNCAIAPRASSIIHKKVKKTREDSSESDFQRRLEESFTERMGILAITAETSSSTSVTRVISTSIAAWSITTYLLKT